MQLADYFTRIGYTGACEPTIESLRSLVRAHALSVPFENLDVQLGVSLRIDPEDAYDKIVRRHRGGWCYEQNGLFGWALSEIGFEVIRVAAAVRRSERGDSATANHLCLVVHANDSDSRWLADVGFGGSMLAPIELRESRHSQVPFEIGLRRTDDGHWQFWEDVGSGEFNYDFVAEPADESTLDAKCDWLQTSPDSGFVQSVVAQMRFPDSHKTLRGKVFSHAGTSGVHTGLLRSPEELVAVLHDTFNLNVPEAADLWPRIERRHEELLEEKAAAIATQSASRERKRSRQGQA